MKKILLSLLMIGVVAATTVGATRAWFTSQGTSDGNTLAAGTITLMPGMHSLPIATLTGLAPGVWKFGAGESFADGSFPLTPFLHIQNTGTLDFKYKFTALMTGETDGGFWDKIWVRAYRNEGGTYVKKYEGVLSAMNLGSATAGVGNLPTGWSHDWRFDFALAADTGNMYQGDSATFNVVVDATQIENPGWTE